MNNEVYLYVPSMPELSGILSRFFHVTDSVTSTDIIITEEKLDFFNNKFIIFISDDKSFTDDNTLVLSPAMPTEILAEAIKTSVRTVNILRSGCGLRNVYKVLDGGDPRVEYFVNKLENILNAAPESILEVDASGAILFHNTKFSHIYDPNSPVIDANIFDIFDEETSAYLKRYMSWELADRNSEFIGRLVKKSGESINIAGHITALQDDNYHFEIIFDDITSKIAKIQKVKKIEEQSIVAGFSRHLSHNVMNALTAAGGFIRQVKAKTDKNDMHTQNLWRIIDEKLLLIEEIVAGYNDYTHATSLMTSDSVELFGFFKDLTMEIAEKRIDRNFSAYLYKFINFYNLTYDFDGGAPFTNRANKMFLKLAVCYIMKDCIRYFGNDSLQCHVSIESGNGDFSVNINMDGVEIPEHIVETMFKPWEHQMLNQSFDYWGIVIALTIMEKHNGKMEILRTDGGLCFKLNFFAPY